MSELAPDRRAHQRWLVDLTTVPAHGLVVDLGCGRGSDLRALAGRHAAPDVRFVGVDQVRSPAWDDAPADDPRISFRVEPLDTRLPFDDGTVDLVFSHNLVECLPDARAFAREVARVLRPGGQAVVAHWDWDTQVFDGTDKARVRRLVAAFADWQQAWMAHADGWMGRRLWGAFRGIPELQGSVHSRVLVNTEFVEPLFGHANAGAMSALVRRGLATPDDHSAFISDQEALHAQARYFYGITAFAWVGVRR